MRGHIRLVTKPFKAAPTPGDGALLLETAVATMQDLYDHYWNTGDRSAAFGLAIKCEQIKKAHVAHEKGQRSEETES